MALQVRLQGIIRLTEQAEPGTPPTGYVYLFVEADGILYMKDDTGTKTACGGGAGGGLSEAEILGRMAAIGGSI